MGTTKSNRLCPKCGMVLHDDALDGLCRRCLGGLGFSLLDPAAVADAPQGFSGPDRLGDYELLGEIARGGMGVVFKARQTSLNRVVAVKMILHGPFSSQEFVQRFRTEAEAVAGLQHPNIVAIYEIGQSNGQHFFSMEYIEGQNLAELVRDQPLPARRAATYLRTIAEAVHYAHRKGVLHRDLKPSNILLDLFDEPRITDFGLAKLVNHDSQLTLTGQTLGSPGYLAPEQTLGKRSVSGPAGDVYSLGAILYHLLTGRPPFQGETLQEILLQTQQHEPIAPRRLNPSVPKDLQTICLKCLQKEPANRYSSAGALAEDLARFLANEPIQAQPATALQKTWLWCRRHPVPTGFSVALLLAVVLGVAGILREWRLSESHANGELNQRRIAEEFARQTSLNLYAADINLASQAIKRGDYDLARLTLAGLAPKPGQTDLRGFEWRYLWNICQGDQLATLAGHTWIVTCAAYSPDGKTLATGSQDGTVKLWDTERRALLQNFSADGSAVWSVAFSPDGKLLMMAGHRSQVQFWDLSKHTVVRSFPGQIAALSTTGTLLATSEASPFYWEKLGKVALWNYATGEKLREFDAPGRALCLSPDGKTLATAGDTRNVNLWDTATGRLSRILATEHPVWSVNFSPAADSLLTAGWSGVALLWKMGSEESPRKLAGHQGTVWSARFSPDGARIVTTSSDRTIWVWDAATLEQKNILRGHGHEVWCAAFRPDGKELATGGKDQMVKLWSPDKLARRAAIPNIHGIRPIFSPDASKMLAVSPDGADGRLQMWDTAGRIAGLELPGGPTSGFSPDGKRLVYFHQQPPRLEIRSVAGGESVDIKLAGISAYEDAFERSGFSPDWKIFFAIDDKGLARFWNPGTGELLHSFKVAAPPIRNAVLGPDGKYFAVSLERENYVSLFETASGRETQLSGHRDFVSGLAFSPDGARLASGSVDGTIKLWEVATGRELATLAGQSEEASDVAYSPDGSTLASIGHHDSVRLWHLATQRELLSIELPEAGMYVQFSPDGRHIAATTDDDTVRLFDAPELPGSGK